jgi:hypothetical protein
VDISLLPFLVNNGYSSILLFQESKPPLKNIGSWSSLATMSSGGGSSSSTKKSTAMASFNVFKQAAKEKEQRVRVYPPPILTLALLSQFSK